MRTPNFKASMDGKRAVLEIYDDIGPSWAGMIDARSVAQALEAAGEASEIDVRINSYGGSAFDGLAICNILKKHPAKVHVRVDGIAASAASIIAMAGDEVVIPKNAMMMIHDPAVFVYGFEQDLLKAAEMLNKLKSAGVETYAAKTKKSKDEIAKLMKEETWFTGEEAVAAGFADKTEDEVELPPVESAAAALNMFRRAPSQLASLFALPQQKGPNMPDDKNKPETPQQIKPETPAVPQQTTTPEPTPATPKAPEATQQAEAPLTKADVEKATKEAAEMAVKSERERANDITALCNQAGRPSMANDFIASGKSVAEVQQELFKALCQDRQPADDGGTPQQSGGDAENKKYKEEYAKQRNAFQKAGVSEEEYIAGRRVDDGLDVLQTAVPAETK